MGGGPSGGGPGRGREEFPNNGFPEGEMDAVPAMAWAQIEGELPDAQIQPPKGERPDPEGIPGQEGGMPSEGIPSEGLPQPAELFAAAALLVTVLLATFLFAKYDRRKPCR